MINPTEILTILQMNGLDKTSSLQDVNNFLTQINYNDEDKLQVISMLRAHDWALPEIVKPAEVPKEVPSINDQLAGAIHPTPPFPTASPSPVTSVSPDSTAYNVMPDHATNVMPVVATEPVTTPESVIIPESVIVQTSIVMNQPSIASNIHPIMPPQKSGAAKTWAISIIVIIIVILLCGSVSYAFINKIGPFAISSYTEDNFSSNMLAKIAGIDSASYTFSGALNVVARDADAVPFTMQVSNDKELKQKYYYDGERIKNIQGILFKLNSDAGYNAYSANSLISQAIKQTNNSVNSTTKSYPGSLDNLFTSKNNGYSQNYSITDPETNNSYQYQVTEGGKNFNLTVTFSTDDAIKAIKGYGYKATSTIVEDKKVTFTKNSSSYVNFSAEPPKPYLTMMSESLSMLPPEVNAKIAVTAASDFKTLQMANWSFNLDAEGDFGDMTYKINADALRKDDNYYFKINNIPSFFLFSQLSALKGKWIVVPAKTATSTATSTIGSSDSYSGSYSPFSSIQKGIPDTEAKYKESRDKFVKFIKKLVAIADEQKILVFKNKPSAETVDGRRLTKYEIGFRKDKIISFYTSVQEMVKGDPELSDYANYFDQGYLDYLKSDEFSQVFDYADKNSKFTIWTDSQGYPAIVQNVSRVVPPDSAIQLKDKQVNLTFKLNISNINKPVEIQTPTDATSLDKITSDFNDSGAIGDARTKGQAAMVESYLSNMRAQAELAYNQASNTYGNKPFALGACKLTAGTLFGDTAFAKLLNAVTKDNPATATCVSSGSTGNVSSWAVSAPIPGDDGFSWCVDSTGMSGRIIDSLKGKSCKS